MASNIGDYEKKMLEMRLQLQENQAYMQDAFGDLEKWTQEIKEKEKKIIENPDSVNSTKGLPPIRNLVTKKKKKRVVKKEGGDGGAGGGEVKKPPKQKINSYDYRSWDKLDIDKMCEEVDQTKTSSSEYTTDEEWEQEQRIVRAEWEKERGNQFFKDNMLDEAIECYTRASNLNPNNAIYVANRAMCYLKQNRYAQADVDCTLSIALDLNYSKAYHRRGTARVNLGKLEEARRDFEQLLKLEPNSKIAQIEINKIDNALEKNNLVFPIIKSESQRSKKPLVRVKIEDINVEETSTERAKIREDLANIQQKIKLTEKDQELFKVSKPKIEELSKDEPAHEKTEIVKKKEDDSSNIKKIDSIKPSSTIQLPKSIPESPSNSYQFKKDWQYLCGSLDNLAAYLKKIDPSEYSKLFLNGLESDNLAKMLEIFNKFFKNFNFLSDSNVDLFKCLTCLAQVKRFHTQLMFLSQNDKSNLDEIIAHLKSTSAINQAELENLISSLKI